MWSIPTKSASIVPGIVPLLAKERLAVSINNVAFSRFVLEGAACFVV
jgi:hypothetical protein